MLSIVGKAVGLLRRFAPEVTDVDEMVRNGIQIALPGFEVHRVEVGPDAVYADIARASGQRRRLAV